MVFLLILFLRISQQVLLIPTNTPHIRVYPCVGTNYIGNKKQTRLANITVIVEGKGKYHSSIECTTFCNFKLQILNPVIHFFKLPRLSLVVHFFKLPRMEEEQSLE